MRDDYLNPFADNPRDDDLIANITDCVAKLLRLRGAINRFREQCRASIEERVQRAERNMAWTAGLEKHLTQVPWKSVPIVRVVKKGKQSIEKTGGERRVPTEPTITPPKKGWVLQQARIQPLGENHSEIVRGWVSPEFDKEKEPFNGPIIPFSPKHKPSLADCYFALAVVHDAERPDAGRIDPFEPGASIGYADFLVQMSNVAKLSKGDKWALGDCLARVEADLNDFGILNPKSDSIPVSSSLTIWFHGDRQYSIDQIMPLKVSEEFDSILQAFLEAQAAMETDDIQTKAGVTNVSRAMQALADWNEGIFKAAVRIPAGKNKGGYFVRIQRL
jgi:hypothetical protein